MRALSAAILSIVLAASASVVNSAERIGVAAMVKSNVTGTIGGRTAELNSGDGVFHRQVISADAAGRAQLIFIDETVFSVGRGATVTLDEFVYNPNRRAGSIVLNVSKGAFRFISGSARPDTYTIKTPVATIGVRGTIFSANVVSRNYMTLNLLQGKLLICPEKDKRVEGDSEKQQPAGPRNPGCTLLEPGGFQIGSGVSLPPAGDRGNLETEPNEPQDVLDAPVQCVVRFGIPECN